MLLKILQKNISAGASLSMKLLVENLKLSETATEYVLQKKVFSKSSRENSCVGVSF